MINAKMEEFESSDTVVASCLTKVDGRRVSIWIEVMRLLRFPYVASEQKCRFQRDVCNWCSCRTRITILCIVLEMLYELIQSIAVSGICWDAEKSCARSAKGLICGEVTWEFTYRTFRCLVFGIVETLRLINQPTATILEWCVVWCLRRCL